MKPEDFHIYKERALRGDRHFSKAEIEQLDRIEMLEWLEKEYKNTTHYKLTKMLEEQMKTIPSCILEQEIDARMSFLEDIRAFGADQQFEKVYIRPARQCGRSITHAKLLAMYTALKGE